MEYAESDAEEGTVIDIFMKGYMFNGRMVRPARVKVAKAKEVLN